MNIHWTRRFRFEEAVLSEKLLLPGVYLWIWGQSCKRVVYVGESECVVRRLAQHLENYAGPLKNAETFVNPERGGDPYQILANRGNSGHLAQIVIAQEDVFVPNISTRWDDSTRKRLGIRFLRECHVMAAHSREFEGGKGSQGEVARKAVESSIIHSLADQHQLATTPKGKKGDYMIGKASSTEWKSELIETADHTAPDLGSRWREATMYSFNLPSADSKAPATSCPAP